MDRFVNYVAGNGVAIRCTGQVVKRKKRRYMWRVGCKRSEKMWCQRMVFTSDYETDLSVVGKWR